MIELRWMERDRELDAFVMEGSRSRTYFVLQFREGKYIEEYSATIPAPKHWIGSEWQDVPREYLPVMSEDETPWKNTLGWGTY